MTRRTFAAGAALAASAALLAGCAGVAPDSDTAGTSGADTVTVGVLSMAQVQLLDDVIAAFEESVQSELGKDVQVTFDVQNANGDQSLITSIARSFASSDYDAFAVVGTPAVIAMATQVKDRPIFALAMGDPVGAGVAQSLEEPGGNVTGSIDYVDPALLISDLQQLHPDMQTVGTVYDPSNQNMQIWVAALRDAAAAAGLQVSEATIAGSAEVAQAARSLVGRSDVTLIGPDGTVIAGLEAVGAAMSGSSIPLYAVGGDVTVPGVVGSLGPDYPSLGASAGVGAAEVLAGADPGAVPFALPGDVEIVLNAEYADTLGITVPASLADRVLQQ